MRFTKRLFARWLQKLALLCACLQLIACGEPNSSQVAGQGKTSGQAQAVVQQQIAAEKSALPWWQTGVVYQIYPRSFKDSNGDGVGDLRGIIEKLDYIKSLGVDIIWLNPVYSSPNADNGYDISNYQDIMTEFGTMADFGELLAGMHQRGLRLVMDLVVNHTSDEHEWFKQSRSSRANPYRHFYHWWPAENGKPPYRRSFFDEKGEAWRYDAQTNAYYLHYFAAKQPDLNWENPAVRDAVYSMMDWWFKKGVDGFRMDVIPFISKDTDWPVITQATLDKDYQGDWSHYYASGPHLHEYLHEMNRRVLNKYDVMALGEGAGLTSEHATDFVDPARQELDLFYHFDGMGLGYSPLGYKRMKPEGWSLAEFKDVYSRWSDVFAQKGWGTIYLGNHDQPRMVSRWGNDSDALRAPSAKLLLTFLLSMRATPFIYQGDELGMTSAKFASIDDYQDIETHTWYTQLKNQGKDLALYIEDWKITARDNGRTPFQWDGSTNAGFSSGKPWLKVTANYPQINQQVEEQNPNSVLHYFRRMLDLRKQTPALINGDYQLIQAEHPQVYAYRRSLSGQSLWVLLNFSTQAAQIDLGQAAQGSRALINNYSTLAMTGGQLELKPYQAVILAASQSIENN